MNPPTPAPGNGPAGQAWTRQPIYAGTGLMDRTPYLRTTTTHICVMCIDPATGTAADNAERMAACWNACLDMPDPAQALATLPREKEELREALERLMRQHDEENSLIDVSPVASCQTCTGGQTPAKYDKGLCAFHSARALLARTSDDSEKEPPYCCKCHRRHFTNLCP